MKKLIYALFWIVTLASAQQPFPPSGGAGVIPSTTDLLQGDGSGNASDSGIPPSTVATQTYVNNAVSAAGSSTPGANYSANQPVIACGVEYLPGTLNFVVGPCVYNIAGVQYTITTSTTLTAAAADATNPRIDAIIVDNTSTASILAGTPAVTPLNPTVDPSTQLQLTFYTVPALATSLTSITTDNIYDENVEWTCTSTAHINCASTNNPFRGTKDIEATAAVLNNSFTLVKPASGTVDLGTRNTFPFYIRSKAKWPVGTSGATAARYLSIWWQNGATQKGQTVVIRDGTFGFNSSNVSTYQQIAIPTSLFGIAGIAVTTLKGTISGPSGSSSIGFYVDAMSLQGGLTAPPLPATVMNYRGIYSAAAAYNPNDKVSLVNGVPYIAKVANTGVAPATNPATWQADSPAQIYGCSITNSGVAVASGASSTCFFPIPRQCTIVGYYVLASPNDTATIKFWRVAAGTALPTSGNSINTSGVSLSTGGAIESTTVSDFTSTAVAYNDLMAANLSAVGGTATYVYGGVLCQ